MTHSEASIARWRREWARLYRAGATLREIAGAANVSHMLVKRLLLEAGVKMRGAHRRPGRRPT